MINMIKANTFLKATATTLAACILMACGGESSESNGSHIITMSTPEMGASQGKTVFSVKVTDNDLVARPGVTPNILPMMQMGEAMGGHMHSTPFTGCTETDGTGNAECTVYFLMPSEMNNVVMGTWDLAFSLPETDEEAIHFTPSVSMAMGDTVLAKLKGGQDDQVSMMSMSSMEMNDMPMTENRTYYIFNNGITGMGDSRSVELYVATKESMTSFPTLNQNLVLNDGSSNEMSVDSIQVQVSSDNSTWIPAVSQGEGIWQASEISGLTETLYVSLAVNGEVKTTDGDVAGTTNASAPFTLSSGGMEM